jgi:hypothetical protein
VACYHPLRAFRAIVANDAGKFPVSFTQSAYFVAPVELPCGRCVGCRLERTRQWAVRAMHEASLHEENCFLTLTYDPAHLPNPPSLVPRHLQLFFKRFRRRIEPDRVSFLACGEYGDLRRRPHYHALVFGYWPGDCVRLGRSKASDLYSSEFLADCWQMGFVSVGTVTFESAAYVARYSLKKINGEKAAAHYTWVDPDTGEVHRLEPEFLRCSLNPAIGKRWFQKFSADVLQSDSVVARGREMKPPRYYDKLVAEVSPLLDSEIKAGRRLAADRRFDEGGTKRLRSREKVAQARVSQFKRELE